jgi:hypothetical protein
MRKPDHPTEHKRNARELTQQLTSYPQVINSFLPIYLNHLIKLMHAVPFIISFRINLISPFSQELELTNVPKSKS